MVAIYTSGRELLVQVEAGDRVAEVVAAGQQWQEGCYALMSKRAAGPRERSAGHRLGKCIRIATSSLEKALEQLELRIKACLTPHAGKGGGGPHYLPGIAHLCGGGQLQIGLWKLRD